MPSASEMLDKLGIAHDKPALLTTAEDALDSLLEVIEDFELDLRVEELSKEEVEILLDNYGSCIIEYHPENSHQERGALLRSWEMLKPHGLTDEDYERVDFC